VGLSLLLLNRQSTGRMIGFSGRVDLGEVGRLRSDPTIAMRVTVPDLPEPPPARLAMHLRGTALDVYDGRTWSQSQTSRKAADAQLGVVPVEPRQVRGVPDGPVWHVELLPIDPPVLFLPPDAQSIELLGPGQLAPNMGIAAYRGPEGELRYFPADERGVAYAVHVDAAGAPSFRTLGAGDARRYLALPPGLAPEVAELAREWTADATDPLSKARAIEARLRKEYRYDLNSPSTRAKDPLEDFLFDSKRGHCEFYSTAMAVMLRTIGVPTRNVTGFVGGTYNRFGKFYVVRQGDAHSWVEAFVPERGWLTFDPTPPADAAPRADTVGVLASVRDFLEATSRRWDRHVVGYDLRQQIGLWSTVSSKWRSTGASGDLASRPRLVVGLIGAGIVVVAVVLWRRRKGGAPAPGARDGAERASSAIAATQLFELLEAAMSARGVYRTAGTPPLRHAQALAASRHPLGEEYLALVEVYLAARFGGQPVTPELRREFEDRVKALKARASDRDAA
jgi:transglutaminase-like putative cysteine protease